MTPLRTRFIEDMQVTQLCRGNTSAIHPPYFRIRPLLRAQPGTSRFGGGTPIPTVPPRGACSVRIQHQYLHLCRLVPLSGHPGNALEQTGFHPHPGGEQTRYSPRRRGSTPPVRARSGYQESGGPEYFCFGAGLRVSEAVRIKISHVDSARMLLRVEQGKGAKDRYTTLSPALLQTLRSYYRQVRPAGEYLFPSWRPNRRISSGVLQWACNRSLAARWPV